GANQRLWFGADDGETKRNDPRCQSEDLGDNAMQASRYGIKNLKRILPNLDEWTKQDGGSYDDLTSMYKAVKDQYFRYMQHVMMNIGGIYITPKSQSDKGIVIEPAPIEKQKDAIAFFNSELFNTPYWILDQKITTLVSESPQPDFVQDLQVKALNKLLDIKKLNQLLASQHQFSTKAFPLDEYISAIHKGIWKELKQGNPNMDSYRRNLQKAYIGSEQNILLSTSADYTETDAFTMIKMDILQLQKEIALAIPRTKDKLTRFHLLDIQERIKKTLEANPVIE
ncbi:MAG: zinc-dependent metalloprotease, partial [Chitinophagaceae bacterium]|nr:zinc-dependent metalloprotease [Chitinophagaceae bacterium]